MRSECERIGKLISGFVDEGLSSRQNARVSAHLATCESCQREVEQVRRLVGRLGGLSGEHPPYDLWAGVQSKIIARPHRGLRSRIAAFAGWRMFAIPAAVAAAALMMLIAHPVGRQPQQPQVSQVAESSAEYSAYMEAYSDFRSRQSFADRDSVAVAAQLQPREEVSH